MNISLLLPGMSAEDARTLLVQNHLGLGSQSEEYSSQPAGTVISQNTAAGSTVKLNSRVNITVSAGPEPVQPEPEEPASSGESGGGLWGNLFGGGSSSSSSTTAPEEPSASSDSQQPSIGDWWASLLG